MRILSARVHGVIDLAFFVAFLLGPLLVGLGGRPAAISYLLAIVYLVVLLTSRYPAGRQRTIPFIAHGIVERVIGLFLMILPSFDGYAPASPARRFYLAMGAAILVVWALTDYRERVVGELGVKTL